VAKSNHCADIGAANAIDTNRTEVVSRRVMLPTEVLVLGLNAS
jgi:hypothetical protein